MDIILKYFPKLQTEQIEAFSRLKPLYEEYNAKVNVISRKDMEQLYLHHVLHSLTLTSFVQWNDRCHVLDLGTGGGFPVIPLAIFHPDVQFTAIDGTGKKIRVVQEIVDALQLKNVKAQHLRAEDCLEKVHFVVSRAVTSLEQLAVYARPLLLKNSVTAQPNGVIAYKGGDLKDEIAAIRNRAYYELWPIHEKFPEDYFLEKQLVYLQLH